MSKKLRVNIELEMTVPDDWQIAETEDGIGVLKMSDGRFLDLTFEPMVAADLSGAWSNDVTEDFMNELLDRVDAESVSYELKHVLN
jgi:hypothetical protein